MFRLRFLPFLVAVLPLCADEPPSPMQEGTCKSRRLLYGGTKACRACSRLLLLGLRGVTGVREARTKDGGV